MIPLEDWDEDFILSEVATPHESARIEKKASAKFAFTTNAKVEPATKNAIAKQVCAFANGGGGFLVFGVTKEGIVDGGVPETVGNQSTKDWVEQISANAVQPILEGCAARMIRVSRNETDKALLVLHIPLSDKRPHWTDDGTAYLRVGSRSEPMSPTTLMDIASRGAAVAVEINSLSNQSVEYGGNRGVTQSMPLRPKVTLLNGTLCRDWAFDLQIDGGDHTHFRAQHDPEFRLIGNLDIHMIGRDPLFRGRSTRVFTTAVVLDIHGNDIAKLVVTASLYANGAAPVKREFRLVERAPGSFAFH